MKPAAASNSTPIVLIVDDEADILELLELTLLRMGLECKRAMKVADAIALLQSQHFDLCLTDMRLSDGTGIEVVQYIEQHCPELPVAVITAYGSTENAVAALKAGAFDYIPKPVSLEQLRALVKSALSVSEKIAPGNQQHTLLGNSPALQLARDMIGKLARSQAPVYVTGESGCGKELAARLIHEHSARQAQPFIAVNCGAIPENLMESEFFGYEKGAFTGAISSRGGRFEEADGGTLFLDEIGDMPLVMQPKFLRIIQEGEGNRLGSNKLVRYDLRVISASNRDLRQEVEKGRFREDLFYRIFSVEIYIPPLRERREDIVPLTLFFMNRVSRRFKKKVKGFSPGLLTFFEEYPWPGNVRQLLHEVEHMIALTPEGERISLKHCSQELHKWRSATALTPMQNQPSLSLPKRVEEVEIVCIRDALRKTNGNKLQASKLLGITRQGLDKKLKRYRIVNFVGA